MNPKQLTTEQKIEAIDMMIDWIELKAESYICWAFKMFYRNFINECDGYKDDSYNITEFNELFETLVSEAQLMGIINFIDHKRQVITLDPFEFGKPKDFDMIPYRIEILEKVRKKVIENSKKEKPC